MSINTYLSIIESKKQTKQTRRRQKHGYDRESFDGCQMGRGCRRMGEKVRGVKNTKR